VVPDFDRVDLAVQFKRFSLLGSEYALVVQDVSNHRNGVFHVVLLVLGVAV
jgi:hypothetical protein